MLVKCKECGHEISSTAQFCPNCGAKQPKPVRKISKTEGSIHIGGFIGGVIGALLGLPFFIVGAIPGAIIGYMIGAAVIGVPTAAVVEGGSRLAKHGKGVSNQEIKSALKGKQRGK